MRRWRPVFVILGSLVFFTLLITYLSKRTPSYDPTPDHASFRTNKWGTKALRELCRRNGLTVETYQRPWRQFAAAPGAVLCVFDPAFGPDKQDVEAIIEWVRAGGHLIVASDTDEVLGYNPGYGHLDANYILLGYLGLTSDLHGSPDSMVQVESTIASPIGYQIDQLSVNSGQRLLPLTSPEQFTQHLRQRVQDDRELPTISPVGVGERLALLSDSAGVIVMRIKAGRGLIYVVSDADILGNGQIGRADNVILAMNLIYARGVPTAVYFDEYHHGRRQRPYSAERLPAASLFPALWTALACLGIYLLSGSLWRFGRPVPLAPERRRSLIDHIRAFAMLYQGAQATGMAAAKAAQQLRWRLTQITGLGPSASPEDLAGAAAHIADIDQHALTQLLNEVGEISPDSELSEAEMLRLVRRIARFEEALNDG